MVGEEEGEALHRSSQRTENIQDLHEDSTSTQVPQCLLCLFTVHILSSLCFAELIFLPVFPLHVLGFEHTAF